MTALASGVGSMPGSDDREYAEAVRVVLGDLSLPHVPELPGRGATASMTGRGLAVVAGLGADLQPAGWRLTDAPGIDHRRARSLLAQDLDQVEEQAQGHDGPFKAQVCGPWTLAATVEKPRGDKVLADHGARRDLAQALAEGVRDHVADLRRRVGTDRLVVQVDEPALPAVLSGSVPTASGFGRHRRVDLPEASMALQWVLAAIAEAGAEPWVHSCAPGVPWALVRGAGAQGLSADLDVLVPGDLDDLAEALEAGGTLAVGVVPSTDPASAPGDAGITERVLRWLDMLGVDPEEARARLVVTPACGLAGASYAWAREAVRLSAAVAGHL
ncbi:uroporphyrinogen decarboxylase/cobalamine-independent methonine synthase family protein [Nocardioides sediminis]|uniref:methionine synthase n=1 Tax=Nocardioides sediminis TaxID=433648 RepID=UPI002D7A0907|nr:methionine synthase [Nocardioides sediminis]